MCIVSVNKHSAVHVDDGARDVAGQVGGQKRDGGTGDILGFAETRGIPFRISRFMSSVSLPAVMSVWMRPGVMEFTRMPSGPSSRAIAFANPRTPALAAL